MSAASPDELDVAQAAALPSEAPTESWLVRHLWSRRAVGLISGHPKVGKTWFGLDVAISVASGTDCLGAFPVDDPGPVLVYLAEDALPRVRERLASLCAFRHLALDALPLFVITAASLRLDDAGDRDRLGATVARFRPRLLVLDPLVRLHGGDENDARYVSALLGFLRTLARRHLLAIALVHHMSKKSRRQLGQALRGSTDLWAWSDSAAYLTRAQGQILLTVEHRAAPAPEPVILALAAGPDGQTPHLVLAADAPFAGAAATAAASPPLADRVCALLAPAGRPLSGLALRKQLRVNNQRLGELLSALEREGAIQRTATGWLAAPASSPTPVAPRSCPPASQAELPLPTP